MVIDEIKAQLPLEKDRKVAEDMLDKERVEGQMAKPKARTDFRLAPEEYALAFERYGIDLTPADIAAQAHAAFKAYQTEMAPIAARIARERKGAR